MPARHVIIGSAFLVSAVLAHSQPAQSSFEVTSVRPSQQTVGPDYNNQLTLTPTGFTARNVTLKRLVAEAWHVQIDQVFGPSWLDHNEYDIEARLPAGATRGQIPAMLKGLLAGRFQLKQHSEIREMRIYELTVGKSGLKIHPVKDGETAVVHGGIGFHGDLRQFADFLAVQFSIPAPINPSQPARAGGACDSRGGQNRSSWCV